MTQHKTKQGEVKAITTKDAPEFKGEGEEVKKEMLPPLAPQETTPPLAPQETTPPLAPQETTPPLTPQETTPPLAPQEGKKRTSVITIQRGKAVRIYFEDGKQVKGEAV